MTGSQMAAILPMVSLETMPMNTPRHTSQLHSTALTNTVAMPAPPRAAYAVVLACAVSTNFWPSAPASWEPKPVSTPA